MSADNVLYHVNTTIANGGSFSFAYPAGRTAEDYAQYGHSVFVRQRMAAYYDAADDFVLVFSAANITVLWAGGVSLQKGDVLSFGLERGTAARDSVPARLEILEDRFDKSMLSLKDKRFGAKGDGVANDTRAVQKWLRALASTGATGWVPPGTYMLDYFDETFGGDLTINCSPKAVFKGLRSYQHFTGDGVAKSFAITDFDFYAAGVHCTIYNNATTVRTYLNPSTAWSISGNVVTLVTPPAVGETLRVVSDQVMMAIRTSRRDVADPYSAYSLTWRGGTFDVSERGDQEGQAAGSALTLVGWFQPVVEFAKFLGYQDGDHEESIRVGIADTGLGFNGCLGATAFACYFRGFSDLAIYATGLAIPGFEGGNLTVDACQVYQCQNFIKVVREAKRTAIRNNYVEEVVTGILNSGDTGNLPAGSDYIVTGNFFKKCSRKALDLRHMSDGAIIAHNVIEDWGYMQDGTTPFGFYGVEETPHYAVALTGSPKSQFVHNVLRAKDWDGSIMVGLRVHAGTDPSLGVITPTGIKVNDNTFDGISLAIEETGGPSQFAGCEYLNNTMVDVTTPLTLLASDTEWSYRTDAGVKVWGVGTSVYKGEWTPVPLFAGGSATFTYTTQVGTFQRHGDEVIVHWKLICVPTHSLTTEILRISGLPFTSASSPSHESHGAVGIIDNVTWPSGTVSVSATISANAAYIQHWMNGPDRFIQAQDITTGQTTRFEGTAVYKAVA